jgi:hypothetical protein
MKADSERRQKEYGSGVNTDDDVVEDKARPRRCAASGYTRMSVAVMV